LKNWLLKILVCSVNAFILSYIITGVTVTSIFSAILLAVVLSILNFFLKPLLVILTIPITIFTLGLFLLVINTFIVLLADHYIDGFKVTGFWPAFWFSLLLSFFNSLVHGKLQVKVHKGNNNK
jgi:putative membrane protein